MAPSSLKVAGSQSAGAGAQADLVPFDHTGTVARTAIAETPAAVVTVLPMIARTRYHGHGTLGDSEGQGGIMPIFHYHVQAFSRGRGHSAVAAAAYRSRSRLRDERTGRTHDFRRKGGLAWSEILLPAHAPESLARRDVLWNQAEAAERRVNARVAREVRMALPRELSLREQARLARRFLEQVFVARGLGVDWNIHLDKPFNPHVHALLTVRVIEHSGLGAKDREADQRATLIRERGLWAAAVNAALAEAGVFARVDHRRLRARGILRAPIHRPYAVIARERRAQVAPDRAYAQSGACRRDVPLAPFDKRRNPDSTSAGFRNLRRVLNAGRRIGKPIRVARAAQYAGISRGRVAGGNLLVETRDAYVLVPYAGDISSRVHRPVRVVRKLRPGSARRPGMGARRYLVEAPLTRTLERAR